MHAILLALTLSAAATNPAPVLLVRGTASAPNAAERAYAATIARNLSRCLTETGIPHDTVDDEAVTDASLAGRRIAILSCCPEPPEREVAALDRFAAAGGRLIVFYSSSPALAAAMGLQLGNYTPPAGHRVPFAFRFHTNAPPFAPALVLQSSRSMRPAFPASDGSYEIAAWEDETGVNLGPAWLRSPRGFWMTHVLLDNGDAWGKRQLLASLAGALDPSLWTGMATALAAAAVSPGPFRDIESLSAAARLSAKGTASEPRTEAALASAAKQHAEMERLIAAGSCGEAVARAASLHRTLLAAYALAQRPLRLKRHGIWDRYGTGLYPGNWDRTSRELADQGVTDVFVNLLTAGAAHYDSAVLPPSATFRAFGDQLVSSSAATARNALRFHVWMICWSLQAAPEAYVSRMRRQQRLQVNADGKTVEWLCPSNPDNQRAQKDAIREVLQKTPVSGIHLDYIRYPDNRTCVCAGCRERFERSRRHPVRRWPGDVSSGDLQEEFRKWRMDQISRFVHDVSVVVKTNQPTATLSAAVYGKYPSCAYSVGQDWKKWVEAGWLDFICPMDYTEDPVKFEAYVSEQIRLVGANRVFPGIGVTATESRLDAVSTLDQIIAASRLGASGYVLFDLNRTVEREVLPYLRLGLSAP
jgi:uncharacterized lipoprotein YddW (UPF0748 family)